MSRKIQIMVTSKRKEKLGYNEKSHTHAILQYSLGWLALLMVGLLLTISGAGAAPPIQRIIIETFFPYYSPTLVHIKPGIAITWENPTSNLHTITHDGCKTNETCAFDSGPIGPHQTFTIQHLPPGYYPYHCTFHPVMRGVLVVEEASLPNEI